jgi:hypothetical protein
VKIDVSCLALLRSRRSGASPPQTRARVEGSVRGETVLDDRPEATSIRRGDHRVTLSDA